MKLYEALLTATTVHYAEDYAASVDLALEVFEPYTPTYDGEPLDRPSFCRVTAYVETKPFTTELSDIPPRYSTTRPRAEEAHAILTEDGFKVIEKTTGKAVAAEDYLAARVARAKGWATDLLKTADADDGAKRKHLEALAESEPQQ